MDDGAHDITIVGNTVAGGGAGANGIGVYGTMTAHVYDITCQGNTVSSVPGSGAYVGVADNVTFIGNTISEPAATGVYVPTLVTGLSIVGNIVQGVTGNNPSGICINDGSVSNVIINTNQLISCAGQGILDNGTNVTIVANTIRSCGGTTHVALEINGGAGKTINSNCITNSLGGPGIQVRAKCQIRYRDRKYRLGEQAQRYLD